MELVQPLVTCGANILLLATYGRTLILASSCITGGAARTRRKQNENFRTRARLHRKDMRTRVRGDDCATYTARGLSRTLVRDGDLRQRRVDDARPYLFASTRRASVSTARTPCGCRTPLVDVLGWFSPRSVADWTSVRFYGYVTMLKQSFIRLIHIDGLFERGSSSLPTVNSMLVRTKKRFNKQTLVSFVLAVNAILFSCEKY